MANVRFPKISKKLTKILEGKDLAEISQVTGLSIETIEKARDGAELPSIEELTKLSRHLGVGYRTLAEAALDDAAALEVGKPQAAPKKPRNASPLTPVNRW